MGHSGSACGFWRFIPAAVVCVLAVLATIGAGVVERGAHRECGAALCSAEGGQLFPRAFCFDAARPPSPEVMEWINKEIHQFVGNTDYQLASSAWATNGTPVNLTWSLVPDGTMLPGLSGQAAAPSELFSRMNQRFNNNQALWISLITQCFDRWSELTGITFTRVTFQGNEWDDGASFPNSGGSGSRGQFRIGMRVLDGQGGVLAFNYYPTVSDMVIDASENWQSSGGNYRFFRNTLMHEIGHGLGLAHCCPMNSSKLMEPALSTAFDGPQHDDLRGTHVRYGDFYEPNNSFSAAVPLGTLAISQTLLPSTTPGSAFNHSSRTSIDRLADQDWFRFTINGPMTVTITATPVGTTYLSGPQNANGSCSAGTAENSLAMAALAVQLYGPNIPTLLATADTNPPGVAESIHELPLTTAGDYYVRVYATSASGPQMYRLSIAGMSGGGSCPQFTLHPETVTVCEDTEITLHAAATGNPQPTLQWRRNGVIIPGATGSSYYIASASMLNVGTYDVVATNTCGSITSDPAALSLGNEPEITSNPQSQSVQVGAELIVSAQCIAAPAAQWRWFRNNQQIAGGTDGILVIPSVTMNDAGVYRAEAFNSCGTTPTLPATITVVEGCYPNCDLSTTPPILNIDDFVCFINSFAVGQSLPHEEQLTHYSNCDGSTTAPVLNVDDFVCFINSFAVGCP